MAATLSISSCWNSSRHEHGYAMLEELAGLGFRSVELSHGIRVSLVEGILEAVRDGVVTISSVHNFCPLPPGIHYAAPNLFQPSARNKTERALWLRHTLGSLRFARDVGAKRVVIHSGSAWFFFGDPDKPLEQLIDKHEGPFTELADKTEFKRLREKVMKRARRKEKKTLPRVVEHYREILEPLRDFDLQLGIENREGFLELPLDASMESFLQELGEPGRFGCWFDSGHAWLKKGYGLMDPIPYLEGIGERLVGWHLHDVSESGRDHQEPGTGIVDFAALRRFLRPEQSVVLELSPKLSTAAIERSRDYILQWMDA
jgi:sugar phosphate isomerase/epimerase